MGAPNGEILANEHLSTGDGSEGEHEHRGAPEAAVPEEQPRQDDADDLLQPPHDDDEAEEDVEPKRFAPSPTLPSAAEIDEHRICHFPFRSWCPHCVAGRALGERRDIGPLGWERGRHMIPVICIDYFYNTSGGLKLKKDLRDLGYITDEAIHAARSKGEIVKCLIVRDTTSTKCVFAHVVPMKGTAEDEGRFVSDLVAEDILWLGHAKLIVRADNESATRPGCGSAATCTCTCQRRPRGHQQGTAGALRESINGRHRSGDQDCARTISVPQTLP